jgi:lysyl endopeptidase
MLKSEEHHHSQSVFNRVILLVGIVMQMNAGFAQSGLPFCSDLKLYDSLPARLLSFSSPHHINNTAAGFSEDVAGYVIKTDLTTSNSGSWRQFSSEYLTWILKLKVNNAAGISPVFSGLRLSAGAKLSIYNRNGISTVIQREQISPSGILSIEYVRGDEVVIELDIPIGSIQSDLSIDAVSFTSSAALSRTSSYSSGEEEPACYTCFSGKYWDNPKRSVVKIITFRESEAIMCTGTLVNNTRQDAKPYILTAQHCINDQSDADRSLFIFGDEDIHCGNNVISQRSGLSGAVLRSSSYKNDFSLVELYRHVPMGAHPYFAGWDISDTHTDRVSCNHHPLGNAKKTSVQSSSVLSADFFEEGQQPRLDNSFWQVKEWDSGFTQGGSSGAALLNGDQRIIGTLTGGRSTCELPVDDYFAKLSSAWDYSDDETQQLKRWLDPISSGKKIVDGFDPFDFPIVLCDTLSNIRQGEMTTLIPDSSGRGFLSGCNGHNINSFAESFETSEGNLTGIQFFVGSVDQTAEGGVDFFVAGSRNGFPGEIISRTYVPYRDLHLYFNYLEFYPYLSVQGKFFVSYSPACSDDNSFAIETAQWREDTSNSAYAKVDDVWYPMSEFNTHQMSTSLYIEPILCNTVLISDHNEKEQTLTLYPNPASSLLIVNLVESDYEIIKVQLVSPDGSTVAAEYSVYQNSILVDISSLKPSIYLLKIFTKEKTYTSRFIRE